MSEPLWQPTESLLKFSHMAQFIQFVQKHNCPNIKEYESLYQWSIQNPQAFWLAVSTYCPIHFSKPATTILQSANTMEKTRWFVDARLNFAENLLQRRDAHPALIYAAENGDRRTISYRELYKKVTSLASHLKEFGVQAGDRVAGFLPNIPETVIAMLAAASIGAIWSACSPEFGIDALMSRFSQIKPKILFAVDGHFYNGKIYRHLEKISALQNKINSIEKIILLPFIDQKPNIQSLKKCILFQELTEEKIADFQFIQLPFDHPLYILYSSGTTGKPKCMVHAAGRTLIQHAKELMLHTNLQSENKIFFYTTCGWMMWNWLVSSLFVGASIVLYEGSPFYPRDTALFDLIDELGISIFGVGAMIIETASKKNLCPIKTHKLQSLQTILTSASPLSPVCFDYVYQKIKHDVCLSSISGGSDIISCFALGNPLLPVYRGELQCIGLGMQVEIFDENGKSIKQQKGELVCTAPFPPMPIYFWNDENGKKYHDAYFAKYPNVWAHGDYAKITIHNGLIIYGRSDATLNPGGVRIGTAEIYREVEKIPEITDCLATSQQWQGSERIILFVTLKKNQKLNDELIEKIKKTIRSNASPRHVPAKIIHVLELPRTMSGKLVELAVKNIIHNKPVKNIEAIVNPKSLEYFRNLDELKS